MPSIKFSNVLLKSCPRSVEYPSLYCRSTAPWFYDQEADGWRLSEKGQFDFTTYFSSLSVKKLVRYASATAFTLEIDVKGAACNIVQTTADAFAGHPVELEETTVKVPASDEWRHISLDLKVDDKAIIVGFKIDANGVVFVRNGAYFVTVPHELREVNLLLSTTTFKKEDYIKRNVALLKSEILDSDDEMASHFGVLVVDNGRTLEADSLSAGGIKVCPNANVGGAGGFARGMIEALESEKNYTHILLMDDDVAVSPESVRRTFNLLRIVNDDYVDAFISGAMLNYEAGNEQWEDTGYMTPEGYCHPAKPRLCLTKFEDVVYNEAYRVPEEIKRLHQRYAAWWYCCIPVKTIRTKGMPLPYFVRYDDAEYGIRCSPEFMTMEGICIWHDPFDKRYNAANELYQTTRNELVAQFTTGFAKNSDFEKEIYHKFTLELKKFGYSGAELILDAFEDFLKGPDCYSAKGFAEASFMGANKRKEKLVPLVEVQNRAHELGLNFSLSQIDRQSIESDQPRGMAERAADYVTNNWQRAIVREGSGYAVIPAMGGVYPAGAIRGKKYIIAIDWYNRSGVIRVKDVKRYKEIERRYKADLKKYKSKKRELGQAYEKSHSRVTSVAFWKEYLGMNKNQDPAL